MIPAGIADFQWQAVIQIVVINILLSGDNALAISLACRNLPAQQRARGILWGAIGAVGLRILLVFFALALFKIPLLKIIGGWMLLWIGIQLTQPINEKPDSIHPANQLATAIKTIIVADCVMSLDNVLGIASAVQAANAEQRLFIVTSGLLISLPLIIWASQLLLRLLDRFRFITPAGAALLGWLAGGLMISDPCAQRLPALATPASEYIAKSIGAILIVGSGAIRKRVRKKDAKTGAR